MTTTVKAAGYPYALETDRNRMGIRSFVGHVVSATTFGRLRPAPPSYELSFQCPRGLSGAPLMIRHGELMLVTGVVIGNQRTEMLVFSERESVAEGKEVVTETIRGTNRGPSFYAWRIRWDRSQVLASLNHPNIAHVYGLVVISNRAGRLTASK